MLLLVTYVLVALGFSFLCSMLEAVLLSVTPAYVARLEKEGHPVAERLRAMKSRVDRPLAAILSLNTIAHTVGAAGAGAQAQVVWGSGVLAVTSAVLTLLILVLSEIIPKTLGAVFWRKLAPISARVLTFMILSLYPLVVLSELITRSMGKGSQRGEQVSREEIAAVAELAAREGLFDPSESRILQNLFRFGELRVRDVMTPRTVVFSIPESLTVEEAIKTRGAMRFSRIPVWQASDDDVHGYVLKDELLLSAARDELSREVGELKREIVIVPENLPLASLFERLLDRREQIALAVDEFGGVAGVVSMEDVIETLLGMEIVDELDATQDMRALARRRWVARAKRLGLVTEGNDGDWRTSSSFPPPPAGDESKE